MTSARDQQIRALYRAALERPLTERASFIADLTGDDVELRKSVELMLSGDDATDLGAKSAASRPTAPELPAGTAIAQYRIDGVIGRGGMGVVYRATDTKLHRPVAIKFLSSVVADADVRRRFRQEAETTSSLNHPHIVTVYDVGEHDGREYIVSELVDGGTLDDWIARTRRRSWRQSVELLAGIADALAAAHAAGVLHRDVKPGNILIGANGYAKLADFGLAKLVDNGAGDPLGKSSRNTRAGVVVGTVAYMSPEQAAGHAVDQRSDVFSFGVVLYELIAGKRPFEAANDLELLKTIAHGAPPPLPSDTPELLRIAIDKALEKEPGDRYQTMQDLAADLKRVTRKPGSQSVIAKAAPGSRTRLPWLTAAGLAVALALALVPTVRDMLQAPAAPPPRMWFEVPAPGLARNGLALSPNGESIAYAANVDGARQIWVRPIGARDARPVAGTDNAFGIFWSPDSRHLAFFADGKLQTIDRAGGSAVSLASTSVALAGAWSRDDRIFFSSDARGGVPAISSVPASGGPVSTVTVATDAEPLQLLPRLDADEKHVVYASAPLGGLGAYPTNIVIASLDGGGRRQIGTATVPSPNDTAGRAPSLAYVDGWLLFLRNTTLVAQPIGALARTPPGDAVSIAENVAEFSASPSVLVYREANRGPEGLSTPSRRLSWFDRGGQRLGGFDVPAGYVQPVLSPDGGRVAVVVPSLSSYEDVWTVDAQGKRTRLTFDAARDSLPVWSPDGARIAFNSGRLNTADAGTPSAIYVRDAGGAGADELVFPGTAADIVLPWDWTRDGRYILFGRARGIGYRTQLQVWALPMSGGEDPFPVLTSAFRNGPARLSPDGHWIAYATNESGEDQIVVLPFPDVAKGKWQISTRGGFDPRWRNDGRELFYLSANGDVMAADVQGAAERFVAGTPRKLFSTGLTIVGGEGVPNYYYAVTGDGQRFLISEPLLADAGSGSTQSINVIVNWKSGLAAN